MNVPSDLRYSSDHEWVRLEGDTATIGITDYAQGELGDVIFVELPETGETFAKSDVAATIEAVKTVADVFMPLSGEILKVNASLESQSELINSDAYGEGWILKIKCSDQAEVGELMDASAYTEIIS